MLTEQKSTKTQVQILSTHVKSQAWWCMFAIPAEDEESGRSLCPAASQIHSAGESQIKRGSVSPKTRLDKA